MVSVSFASIITNYNKCFRNELKHNSLFCKSFFLGYVRDECSCEFQCLSKHLCGQVQ